MVDPRFEKVVALMRGATIAGERDAARARADSIARAAGMTLDQALADLDGKTAPPKPALDFFHGFDDWMEEREPGYKAKRAAEKAEKARQRDERRSALLHRYGSKEAVEA